MGPPSEEEEEEEEEKKEQARLFSELPPSLLLSLSLLSTSL